MDRHIALNLVDVRDVRHVHKVLWRNVLCLLKIVQASWHSTRSHVRTKVCWSGHFGINGVLPLVWILEKRKMAQKNNFNLKTFSKWNKYKCKLFTITIVWFQEETKDYSLPMLVEKKILFLLRISIHWILNITSYLIFHIQTKKIMWEPQLIETSKFKKMIQI